MVRARLVRPAASRNRCSHDCRTSCRLHVRMSASGGPHRRSANSQSTDSTSPALDGRVDACSTCYAGTGLAVPLRRRACSLGLTLDAFRIRQPRQNTFCASYRAGAAAKQALVEFWATMNAFAATLAIHGSRSVSFMSSCSDIQ
jgi:hypothetical protein